jgi:hypothetical protein
MPSASARRGVPAAIALAGGWLLLLLLAATRACAQGAPTWQGVVMPTQLSVAGTAVTTATAADPATGAVFVTGYFRGQVAFGNTVLTNAGTEDTFVARYDPGPGTWAWARREGGPGLDRGTGIAADGQGGVYMVGSFVGSATYAGQALSSAAGTTDVVVVAYDAATGSPRWARRDGSTSDDNATSIATDGQGGLYVAGYFALATTLAGQALSVPANSQGTTDMFVAAYAASDGTGRWATGGGGNRYDYGRAIAADGQGGVYVTGSFPEVGATFAGKSLNSVGSGDVFVAAYAASDGTGRWAISGGSPSDDGGQGIATDGQGGVYVTGSFQGSALGLSSAGGTDAFVAAYAASDGTSRWAQRGGGISPDAGYAIATDGQGGVYMAGALQGSATLAGQVLGSAGSYDAFVAAYAASTGASRWAKRGGSTSPDHGYGLAAGGGQVYAGIRVGAAAATFGPYAVPANAATLGILDQATGTWQAAASSLASPTGGCTLVATAVDPATGAVFVMGTFTGQVTFGNTVLVSAGTEDVFVARYDPGPGTWAWARREGGTDHDQGTGIAVDGQGGVYVTGSFAGSATVAGQPLSAPGTTGDVFVAAYDAATGSARWVQQGGGPGSDIGWAIATDGQGGVYVTGAFTGNAIFAGQALSSAGPTNAFVAAYEASTGAGRWAQRGGGPSGPASGQGIATDAQGGVYVTGNFAGSATFAGQVLAGTAGGDYDVFVAAYAASDGSGRWATSGGGPSVDLSQGIAVDGQGGVYVTGSFMGSATFVGQALTSAGISDVFVAAYAASTGAGRWAIRDGGPNSDQPTGLVADGQGGVCVVGTFNTTTTLAGQAFTSAGGRDTDVFVADYAATTGSARWVKRASSTADDYSNGITRYGTRLYVGALMGLPATFDAVVVPATGSSTQGGLLAWLELAPVGPLPVQLVAFTAAAEGPAAVRLAWATASEKNSRYFEVERSADGVGFAAIGTVAAAGTTATARTYALRDAALPAGAAVLYYRLRQVDLDGTAHYSPVRSVAVASGLTLYPNPTAGGAATLAGVVPGAAVQVLDGLGRVAATATADATGTARVGAGLAPGVYVVRAGSAALRLVVE